MKRILFIVVCFACKHLDAQNTHPNVPFEHLSIPGTINSSQVTALVQDPYGLLWAAGDGLFKYDGYRFIQYKSLSTGESIAGQEIKYLFSDKKTNRLLIGTHSFGLVQYNYNTNQITPIPTQGGTPIITQIEQTNDGTVWAGSFSNGLYYLENDTLRKIRDPEKKFRSVTSLLSIGNKLLVDNFRSIYILKDRKVADSINLHFPGFDFPILTRVTTMTPDQEGKIWVGTERAGVLVYDTLTKKFSKHFSPEKAPFFNRINRIMVDSKKSVWILCKSNGVVVYSPQTDNYIHITKNPFIERSLSGNNCTSILQDNNGIIWVGSTGDLNKYDPSKIKFRHIYNNPFSPLALSDNMVRGLHEDSDGKLWVGTDGGIIHILDRQQLKVEKIEVKVKSYKQNIVPVYFQDLNETIMLIGSPIGLLQFDRKKKTFDFFKPLEHITRNRQVRQILKKDETLYLMHGGSMIIYNTKTGEIQNIHRFGTDSIPSRNATTIYLDSQKRLWLGVNNGVSLYNEAENTFKFFPIEVNASRPLGTYFMILSIHEHNNKLWIGTFNSGLWSMDLSDLSNPKLKGFTEKDGLPNNTVYATLPDRHGNLWISTNQGVSKFELEKNRFTNFTTSDGLQHEEFNRLAYLQCASGEFVFGGINGLNIFNPDMISIKEENYKPTLLSASVFQEEKSNNQYMGLIGQSNLLLGYDQNDIDFDFFVPNYRLPKRFETYYKLSGYDPDWVKVDMNTIHYSNLKPGSYIFQLKTISSLGTEKIFQLPLTIQHPFWQTWWFVLLSAGIVSFMVITIIQSNVKKSKKDKERLEQLLKQRTQEIEKSKEELTHLNEKKDLIFSILSHDLRAPLTTLKGFLSILIDDNDLSKEETKKHASNIRNSVTSSLDLIDNTLFWSLSQTGNITYTPSAFSVDEMLLKIGGLYQLTADKKRIQFSVQASEKVLVLADENMIYVTLRNLVSNALKYTSEGKSVRITAGKNHKFAEIVIQDEGIGMSPAYTQKLMAEEQLPLKKGTSNEKGTGLGLILCKKFIQLNLGHIEVTSVEGKGTQFIVKLPLA